jgi:tRNA pseudouridine38-40 synthase
VSIALRIAYDGTDFHGFARHPELRTVQGEIEAALARLYKTPVQVRGASRTDAGVHALGQLVAFDPPFAIPLDGLLSALAGELRSDVSASAAWEQAGVDGGRLEPRFHNDGKHYRYRIRNARARNPLSARYEWHVRRALDVDAMRAAASDLVGTHDFAGFRAANCQAFTTVRRVTRVEVKDHAPTAEPPPDAGPLEQRARIVDIEVEGDAFLKNMVRIMAGTLVEVGLGKRPAASIPDLIRRRDRREAGATAPAHGLVLVEVKWTR